MAATTPNTIVLRGQPTRDEAIAGGAITPGHLVAFSAANTVIVNANGGQQATLAIAVESPYQRADGTAAINIAYNTTTNKRVRFVYPQAGDQFYGWVKAGGSVAVATLVGSNGDGTFDTNPGTAAGSAALAIALETVSNGAGTVAARIKLQAL